MKYGKTYSTLLSTSSWPQEWRDVALDYSGLKKLLNAVVEELAVQGLNPVVLNELLDAEREYEEQSGSPLDEKVTSSPGWPPRMTRSLSHRSRAQYEITLDKEYITPQLRLWLYSQSDSSLSILSSSTTQLQLESSNQAQGSTHLTGEDSSATSTEAIVVEAEPATPLMKSTAGLLNTSNPLYILKNEYDRTTRETGLIEEVDVDGENSHQHKNESSLPSSPSFDTTPGPHPESSDDHDDTREVVVPLTADTAFHRLLASALNALASLEARTKAELSDQIFTLADAISSCSGPPSRSRKSDLYAWREIFQLWVECHIYQGGVTERERASGESGIRGVDEAEKRLGMFASEIVKRGLGDRRTLKSPGSREALEKFLNLNVHILDLKKFQLANAEAARKILKKHQKRTALPTATSLAVLPISQSGSRDLPQMLIMTLTETLLPILPKNLDVALMNFMTEWFPVETKEKAKSNERESAQEQLVELGMNPNGCTIA